MPLLPSLLIYALLAVQTSAFPKRQVTKSFTPYIRNVQRSNGIHEVPSIVHNGPSTPHFELETLTSTLEAKNLLSLDAPQLDFINGSVFDWWYFDAVSENNPDESLVLTFFSSTASAFPFLAANQSSILTVWIWASFANGTIFADYVPATVARLTGVDGASTTASGNWFPTGFGWQASTDPHFKYEVTIASEKLQVHGKFTLTSTVPYHLPCGHQGKTSILEIAPHIGWVNTVPDAVGAVDVNIRGSSLSFKGPAYHDKTFMESVESWYWGHGRLGEYSIVWFSYLALNDTTNSTYVSSYVAKDGKVLVSDCDSKLLTVRPIGDFGTTGTRYPPKAGDIPVGFHLDFDLGEAEGHLKVNVSTRTAVAGDGEYYVRWTGDLIGEGVKSGGDQAQEPCTGFASSPSSENTPLTGVAVFEQFAVAE